MTKNTNTKHSSANGRCVTNAIGVSKAGKFGLVEGVELNASSQRILTQLNAEGLKGDSFRNAVVAKFKRNRDN